MKHLFLSFCFIVCLIVFVLFFLYFTFCLFAFFFFFFFFLLMLNIVPLKMDHSWNARIGTQGLKDTLLKLSKGITICILVS